MAIRRPVNPWHWQDAYGFSQAVEVCNAGRQLVCAGQTSVAADGSVLHPGDMAAQLRQALDNLGQVLAAAGMDFDDIVRLNYYTTDIAAYLQVAALADERFTAGDCRPAGTLLGVAALFHPDILIELEATAID